MTTTITTNDALLSKVAPKEEQAYAIRHTEGVLKSVGRASL